MIFEERTIYLHQTVKAGDKELYKGFDVSDAWRAMLEATNDQEVVEMIVRRMSADEAKRAKTSDSRRGSGHRSTRTDSPTEITTIPG